MFPDLTRGSDDCLGARSDGDQFVDLCQASPEELVAWRFLDRHPKATIFPTPELVRVYAAARSHRPIVRAARGRSGECVALLAAVRVDTM